MGSMILIADSGSSKADWILIDQFSIKGKYSTIGFNPYFHTEKVIFNSLKEHNELSAISSQIEEVFFYGAGCANANRNVELVSALSNFFTKAKVSVESDMLGAVHATCGKNAGIVGILGTGSNCCYFDGAKIHDNNFGLGFILGDEAGGTYFGKMLVTHYLYGNLPENLHQKFSKEFVLTKEILLTNVYNNPGANVWLASFAKFFVENREDAWVQNTARAGIEEFFDLYICGVKDFKNLEVHFVGTMAFYFEDIIRKIGEEKNVIVKKIIRYPVDQLAEYFLTKIRN